MRYIKTKDGKIFENKNYVDDRVMIFVDTERKKVIYKVNNNAFGIEEHGYSIIQQADTIEELVDGYVCVGIPNRTFMIDEKDYKEQGLTLKQYVSLLFAQYEYISIYGAIWTDKGLIYVAKMNEKGELELI